MPPKYLLTPGLIAKISHLPFALEIAAEEGNIAPGKVFYVSSVLAVGNGQGTKSSPYATRALALAACTADNGDLIYELPGHAETVTDGTSWNVNKAGVTILGLGNGADRPTYTFQGSTAAAMLITANNVTMKGIILKCNLDQVVSPLVISGADCAVDIETQDGAANKEFVIGVLTTATADRLVAKVTHRGFVTGTHTQSSVRLVGCDGGRIDVDFYGRIQAGTDHAVVDFNGTACTNVEVTGRFYVSGTTDYSLNVVDTVTGSIWTVRGFDAAADKFFSGGNAVAVATDPSITSVTDALYGTAGIATWLTAAAYGNNVSLSEVVAFIQDAVRKGSGTAVAANKSLADAIGYDGNAAVTSTAGMLRTAAGSTFVTQGTVISSSIPNNTQTGGAITGAASGAIVIEDIVLETDATGVANPTNVNFTTDNVSGLTGASNPVCAEAVSALGAGKTISMKAEGTTKHLPFTLETGKKLYISGSSAGGTGAGVMRVTLICRRVADGNSLAAVNI